LKLWQCQPQLNCEIQLWLRGSRFVAVVSGGEGWHNWHHTYPFDYAASELGSDSYYNPTKMFIDVCAFVGLVKDQKRALNAWSNLQEKQMKGEQSKEIRRLPSRVG
jgi:stearoyl-CoA desaturase (delta-9 desaturase)